jgi:hypothetical protein
LSSGGLYGGAAAQSRRSYSGRLAAPLGTSGAGITDRTVSGASASVSRDDLNSVGLSTTGASIGGRATTGFGQQSFAGGRLGDDGPRDRLARTNFGIRGELAADQDYKKLLSDSRATYDRNRSGALAQFDTQLGENRTEYEAQVETARAAHEARWAPQVASAQTAYDTATGFKRDQYDRRANTAEGTWNYIRSRPSHTTFGPGYIRDAQNEYNATRGPYRASPFVSPAPEFRSAPYEGGEFNYPDFVPPEREGQYTEPTGSSLAPAPPRFTSDQFQGEVPSSVQWYSAPGGYHFRPEDIVSRDANKITARATRYNGVQNERSYSPGSIYAQTAPLTPAALQDFSIYRGNIL